MPYYYKLGQIPHKRHTQFRQPDGSLYHEEVMGIHGFSGIQSILYHVRPPTQVERSELFQQVCLEYEPAGPLKHRLFKSLSVPPGGDAVEGRIPLMGNPDVVLSIVRPDRPMSYWYRFAHGDEVIFVHEGKGML